MTRKKRARPPREDVDFSSPACLMHEADPAYMGFLPRDELLALLNELLEAERAGAKVAAVLQREATDEQARAVLRALGQDEGRFCAMLAREIERLGGQPSGRTGAFREKVLALESTAERLALLNRGQGWVARKLREALPKVADAALRDELKDMLAVHERNIARCNELPG